MSTSTPDFSDVYPRLATSATGHTWSLVVLGLCLGFMVIAVWAGVWYLRNRRRRPKRCTPQEFCALLMRHVADRPCAVRRRFWGHVRKFFMRTYNKGTAGMSATYAATLCRHDERIPDDIALCVALLAACERDCFASGTCDIAQLRRAITVYMDHRSRQEAVHKAAKGA